MCNACDDDDDGNVDGDGDGGARRPGTTPRRKKLWQTDARLHCSIIGTCLSMGDLYRIIRKLRIDVPEGAEDYNIHGYFVGGAGEPGPETRLVQKTLERRYATAVRRFSRITDEAALLAAWQQSLDDGDIPGPYWALVTHATAPEGLVWRANGQVHMLSHLVGASNRADIRRLRALEAERDGLREEITRTRRTLADRETETRRLIESHALDLRELGARLTTATTSAARLQAMEARLRELESGEGVRELEARVDGLAVQVAAATGRAEAAEALAQQRLDQIDAQNALHLRLEEELQLSRRDGEALEAAIEAGLGCPGEGSCPVMDLSGLRIVYVGGRTGLIPRLRDLVERANGVFIHHDGGIEDSADRLGEVLGRGDAILCPIDRVSHTACQAAKRLCKQRCKAFVPLRSSGLSAFVSGLQEVAAAAGARPEEA